MRRFIYFFLFLILFTFAFADEISLDPVSSASSVSDVLSENSDLLVDILLDPQNDSFNEINVSDPSSTTSSVEGVLSTENVVLNADKVILSSSEEPQLYSIVSDPVSGGCFIDVDSSIGFLKIYVPSDYQYKSFSFFNGTDVCSIVSSTITCYAFEGSTVYQIRFSPFSEPTYRVYDTSQSYQVFSIYDVIDTNVQILKSDSELPLLPDLNVLLLICISFLGGIFVCRLLKR